MNTIPFHPIANVFPSLEGPAFDELVADVAEHGVREPIWLYNGAILDGRNRYRAALQAGVDCPCRTYEGDDPIKFVISLNLRRRHLTESQRAMVAARLATMRHGGDRKSEDFKGPIGTLKQDDAAKILQVGPRTVKRARRVVDQGVPEIVTAVDQGELAVSAAMPLTDLPTDQQAEALAESKAAAGNGKVTARHTKAVVLRKQRLQRSDETPPSEMSGRETVNHAPNTQDIPHPTSGQTTALAQVTGQTTTSEGHWHAGRPQELAKLRQCDYLRQGVPIITLPHAIQQGVELCLHNGRYAADDIVRTTWQLYPELFVQEGERRMWSAAKRQARIFLCALPDEAISKPRQLELPLRVLPGMRPPAAIVVRRKIDKTALRGSLSLDNRRSHKD